MKTATFIVSKGGVGKSLITANVGAALAEKGKRVLLVEGDPNNPLQLMLDVNLTSTDATLDSVLSQKGNVEKAVHATNVSNLSIIPLGVSLQRYFAMKPVEFAEKIASLHGDFLFVDAPFPLGNAAFLSLGICQYFVPILTEDELALCVEATLDTIRVGSYYLKCVPLGFILNRLKSLGIFTKNFIGDLEDLLGIRCLTKIEEDLSISKSYGGAGAEKAFLAYDRFRESRFAGSIDKIADFLLGELPPPEKEDIGRFVKEIVEYSKTPRQ